ncbi:hypothetical protein HYH02_002339 [Chlamydomonas schloesseri]|uniref:Carbohydrate kinase PfkB domain-containing protein n=1 Tax=Chlamydomonas schloesseri TaxID=2026947 RepID=A0A835WTI4_9CHLO|nr:hypothetical protein HYH02_002339 [Chlamydomonas schloesseri]|eukprot:KAG2453003.1 hypothetical protein HYH02_002339 [Chlamydomonas schloesseri]
MPLHSTRQTALHRGSPPVPAPAVRVQRPAARSANIFAPCGQNAYVRGSRVPSAASSGAGAGEHKIDVCGLGNLCVDAVLPLPELPPPDRELRRQLLDTLTASPPPRSSWEVGGNCNFMVAASRLGLATASVGHIGTDIYGGFMDEVLREEGVQATTRIAPTTSTSTSTTSSSSSSSTTTTNGKANGNGNGSAPAIGGGSLDSTLICFVLVDPASRHAFCSRYDFGPWPLLDGISALPERAQAVLRSSRAIFTNGFIFDELPLQAVQACVLDAISQGAAIFFDPGPRCQTMLEGPRRAALDLLLDLSCVVLMTEEEAHVVTGLQDAEEAAKWVLARPNARAQWVVVKMGAKGAVLCTRGAPGSQPGQAAGASTTYMGAVKVEVVDTVGCGDSFAAAIVMGFINGWAPDVTLALANAVGGATAMGRGAGRNVARPETVLRLLGEGAAGGVSVEQRAAFARAKGLLQQQLAKAQGRGLGQGQLSAAA